MNINLVNSEKISVYICENIVIGQLLKPLKELLQNIFFINV